MRIDAGADQSDDIGPIARDGADHVGEHADRGDDARFFAGIEGNFFLALATKAGSEQEGGYNGLPKHSFCLIKTPGNDILKKSGNPSRRAAGRMGRGAGHFLEFARLGLFFRRACVSLWGGKARRIGPAGRSYLRGVAGMLREADSTCLDGLDRFAPDPGSPLHNFSSSRLNGASGLRSRCR